jgi:predicted RNase H-like HicB family nuclease
MYYIESRGKKLMRQDIAFINTGGPVFRVVFSEFPGCVSAGKSFEDMVHMAHEALFTYIEYIKEVRLRISDLNSHKQDKKTEKIDLFGRTVNILVLIALFPGYETRKYTILMNSFLIVRIDAVTKNRSTFLK